jgi:long-chain acyl-CoA synthetase
MQQGRKKGESKANQGMEIPKTLTIPKLFLKQAEKFGKNTIAMREKEFGIWRPITWHDYLENVKHLTLGLISIGLKNQDKICMIGTNRPEGLWAEMATMCARGIGVWLFQECLIDEVKYIIDNSDTRFIFCERQEEVDKALSIFDECPKLEKIIWDDPKGMRDYEQDYLISFKDLQQLGRELDQKQPHLFEEIILKGHGDETALLFYTSGTTALPKGALLSHDNMLTMGKNLMTVDPCLETDDYVSCLPFAWIGEQMMSI